MFLLADDNNNDGNLWKIYMLLRLEWCIKPKQKKRRCDQNQLRAFSKLGIFFFLQKKNGTIYPFILFFFWNFFAWNSTMNYINSTNLYWTTIVFEIKTFTTRHTFRLSYLKCAKWKPIKIFKKFIKIKKITSLLRRNLKR